MTYHELMAAKEAELNAVYRRYAPTSAELAEHLGPHWAICRNTHANRYRYGNCITEKHYQSVVAAILNARASGALKQ